MGSQPGRRGSYSAAESALGSQKSKINLCIFTHLPLQHHTGAVDRIMSFARNVSKNNVDVFLINRSLEKSFSSLLVDEDKYYQIRNGQIKELEYPLSLRLLFPGPFKVLQEIINRMLSVLTFSVLSEVWLSYVLDPYLLVKLLFVCRKEKVDVMQGEFPATGVTGFLAKRMLNIPLVSDSHEVETDRITSMKNVGRIYIAATKLIEKACCDICDSVFAVSELDKKTFVSWGISEQKIHVIPNSVELSNISASIKGDSVRNEYNLGDNIVLIFHGDLGYPPNREACQIIENNILPDILKENPSVHFLIVGGNPPVMSSSNIITTGFVKDLHQYIAAADIAVVPLLKGGGTRIKILEYMACRKAVVSTEKGAEGLSLQNGYDILMTKYPDSKFTDLVLKLVKDKNLRDEIALRAREKIEALYDWEKTAKNAVLVYQKLVAN